jgi:hypothetical protein
VAVTTLALGVNELLSLSPSIERRFTMLLSKFSYFALSSICFLVAGFPFLDEMRNGESFYTNLKRVLRTKKPGARLLAMAFLNMCVAASLFIFPDKN